MQALLAHGDESARAEPYLWMDEDKFQQTLQEWEKRRAAAEGNRKNRLLPLIIKKLEEVQGTSSAVSGNSNVPSFLEVDE